MGLEAALPWVFALAVTAAHYVGNRTRKGSYDSLFTSVTVGVTVAYVFLDLLPRHVDGLVHFGDAGFLSVLVGFAGLHAVEKYILQHEKQPDEIRHDFKELHTAFLLFYYTVIGVTMHYFFQQGVVEGALFAFPVLLHTGVSSLSPTEIHEDLLESTPVRALLTVATPLGVGLATVLTVSAAAAHLVIGTLAGMFLYIMISDSIAQQEEGHLTGFLGGLTIYSALIVASWLIA